MEEDCAVSKPFASRTILSTLSLCGLVSCVLKQSRNFEYTSWNALPPRVCWTGGLRVEGDGSLGCRGDSCILGGHLTMQLWFSTWNFKFCSVFFFHPQPVFLQGLVVVQSVRHNCGRRPNCNPTIMDGGPLFLPLYQTVSKRKKKQKLYRKLSGHHCAKIRKTGDSPSWKYLAHYFRHAQNRHGRGRSVFRLNTTQFYFYFKSWQRDNNCTMGCSRFIDWNSTVSEW